MSFFAYRVTPFEFTHENKIFNHLYDLLQQAWGHKDEPLHLIGNVYIAGRPVDALVIKPHAIVVIDFKDYGGDIAFSENGHWYADKVTIKGGGSINPYQQIRNNKFALLNFLQDKVIFQSEQKLGHIAGLCLFHQDIIFDEKQLPATLNRWFHVADITHVQRTLDAIGSNAINLSTLDIEHIIKSFDLSRYYPDSAHQSYAKTQEALTKAPSPIDINDFFQNTELTKGQKNAVSGMGAFLSSKESGAYLLHGYAGTGKTFIAKGIVDYITALGRTCELMAPTGKAAKVIADKTNHSASTIHKAIYDFSNTFSADENETKVPIACLKRNLDSEDAVYIVDEASMLSDAFSGSDSIQFGSGYLLRDLLTYIRDGEQQSQRKVIFIGDDAQLPPIGMRSSPALDPDYLREKYKIQLAESTLTEVVRQKAGSGVMDNAVTLRLALDNDTFNQLDFDITKSDVESLSSDVFIERYMHLCESKVTNTKEVVILSHSNAQVDAYNRYCREIFFPHKSTLCAGDKVIAVANHYRADVTVTNGEFGLVRKLLSEPETRTVIFSKKSDDDKTEKVTVKLAFRDVEILFRDESGSPVSVTGKVIEHLLYNDKPSLTADESKALHVDFLNRHPHLKRKGMDDERKKALKDDPYFNAFKVKFGYAITCHKAQGSEWKHVLVNCSSPHQRTLTKDYFRWLYTAITRTSSKLYVLNEPKIKLGSNAVIVGGQDWNMNEQFLPDFAIQASATDSVPFKLNANSALNDLFRKVQACIANKGIEITDVRHYQYQELYVFKYEDQFAEVQFNYNAKHKVSSVQVRGSGLLQTTLQSLLATFEGRVLSAVNAIDSKKQFVFNAEYLEHFHHRIVEVFSGHEICVSELSQIQWLQRYTLTKSGNTAVIDFHYNGKKQFTKVTPMKNLSSSEPLLLETINIWQNA